MCKEMKEEKNDFIKKFIYKDYFIYIKDCKTYFESYLQHEESGIMMLMFGIDKAKNNISLYDYIKLIENNLHDYIKIFKNDFN